MTALVLASLILAAIPAALFLANLAYYRRLPALGDPEPADPRRAAGWSVSVLIPARNEEASISGAVESVLANRQVTLEVIVLDDHSTDRTGSIVDRLAAADPRVRRVPGRPLPPGWCGKQHACWQLAWEARHELLVFMDADVRLAPDALARMARFLEDRGSVHLASGVPRQLTSGWLERLLIPLIHFVLLGFLPMPVARRSRWTAFAAGCGQLMVARRNAYFAADGHRSIRASLHDGVKLPRSFRSAGFQTDLFDATDLATCRMYTSGGEVWRGLGKNATEGMGHPAAIVPWTVLLLGGQVMPWILWPAVYAFAPALTGWVMAAVILGVLTRGLAAWRFRQSGWGVLLHPASVGLLIAIQWQALFRKWRGRPMEWRGRRYAPEAAAGPVASSRAALG